MIGSVKIGKIGVESVAATTMMAKMNGEKKTMRKIVCGKGQCLSFSSLQNEMVIMTKKASLLKKLNTRSCTNPHSNRKDGRFIVDSTLTKTVNKCTVDISNKALHVFCHA